MSKQERYERFTEDMENDGREVRQYRGRYYYEGPAVEIDDADELQDVIRATEVSLQWDELGKNGLIIYPR